MIMEVMLHLMMMMEIDVAHDDDGGDAAPDDDGGYATTYIHDHHE